MNKANFRMLHYLINCQEEINNGKLVPAEHYIKLIQWELESNAFQNYYFGKKLIRSITIVRAELNTNLALAKSSLEECFKILGKEVFNGAL
jgi:hypothetical protein